MGVLRWLRRAGVENPARGATGHIDQKHFVYYTIENAPFQKWVVFVAAVGFLTDAYDIFALTVVSQIVPWVYWDQNGIPDTGHQAALLCSTLAGTFIGQALFGVLGDLYGRRKIYGMELIILIVGSIGTAMASEGSNQSMSIIGWLIFWRMFMGVGIGADYPISAVITSEFAPRKHRARMLAFVFWMQAIGQVLVYAIALIVLAAYKSKLSPCVPPAEIGVPLDGACLRVLDQTWRWIVGLGAVPAAVAIFFRLTIPQSPRYLMYAADQVDQAAIDTAAYFGPSEVPFEMQQSQSAPLTAPATQNETTSEWDHSGFQFGISTIQQNVVPKAIQSPHQSPRQSQSQSSRPLSRGSSVPSLEPGIITRRSTLLDDELPHMSWWAEFQDYFFRQGNWRFLAGTAGTWFLLDFPFYGLELSSASIINAIWNTSTGGVGSSQPSSVYDTLYNTVWRDLVMTGVGALVGGAVFIKLVKHVSPKTMQGWGFVVLTVLLLVTAIVLLASGTETSAFVVLYVLVQLNFSLGPNTTTYLIPAELFPTRFRCTCHGISAAAGRLGGIAAQLIVTLSPFGQPLISTSPSTTDNLTSIGLKATTLGKLFAILCIFPALGAGLTWLLTPETRDKHGQPRSLETLAKGHGHLKKLKGETDPDDKDQ